LKVHPNNSTAAPSDLLFKPFSGGGLNLANRIVMAPMTRNLSPGGIPNADVAAYYRRRAEGGVGLIITEGTWVPHPSASNEPDVPRFYGKDALAGWQRVVDEVHAAGGKIVPQLWHIGLMGKPQFSNLYEDIDAVYRQIGPSGMVGTLGVGPKLMGAPATGREIDEVTKAFVEAARSAYRLGFDGVELHAAHGYLIDQFFWHGTNLRTDEYGGSIRARTRFAADLVREIRAATSPDFPIILRISQWKVHDYEARLAESPEELAEFLEPLVAAGVDIFDCSQRRFWEGEFGTDVNFAGWVKKLTGKPVITVGSVTLNRDVLETNSGLESAAENNLSRLFGLLERGDFDLVAVGRALIMDPDWPKKVRMGREDQLKMYDPSVLATLK
jgi:2,4-dienoyl-CoA reductase-like NADH-dependent reductase (Old Yellow Enzyme family)